MKGVSWLKADIRPDSRTEMDIRKEAKQFKLIERDCGLTFQGENHQK